VGEQRLLYVQVQENLAKLITSGEWQPDTRILSERKLSEQIGVSRVTVRQAIRALEQDGLLYRIQGKGTFVAKPHIEADSRDLISFTSSMTRRGIRPSGRVLGFDRVPASREVARALEIDVAQQVYRVHRLRFGNSLPLLIELSFFSCEKCPGLEEVDLATTSIRSMLENMGIYVERVSQTLRAVAATPGEAQLLDVEPGFPLMLVERVAFDAGGDALEYSKDRYRGDCSRFLSDLSL
jgi:GntR family transcriptional regulator